MQEERPVPPPQQRNNIEAPFPRSSNAHNYPILITTTCFVRATVPTDRSKDTSKLQHDLTDIDYSQFPRRLKVRSQLTRLCMYENLHTKYFPKPHTRLGHPTPTRLASEAMSLLHSDILHLQPGVSALHQALHCAFVLGI